MPPHPTLSPTGGEGRVRGERRRGLLFDQGPLLETTVDPEADRTEQEIRHPHHQVDAVIVGASFAERIIVFLRTGGGNRILSGRASVQRARPHQQDDDEQQTNKPRQRTHVIPFLGALTQPRSPYCSRTSRPRIEPIEHPIDDDARDSHVEPDRQRPAGDNEVPGEAAAQRQVGRVQRQRRDDGG
jgi:hypothetical protein